MSFDRTQRNFHDRRKIEKLLNVLSSRRFLLILIYAAQITNDLSSRQHSANPPRRMLRFCHTGWLTIKGRYGAWNGVHRDATMIQAYKSRTHIKRRARVKEEWDFWLQHARTAAYTYSRCLFLKNYSFGKPTTICGCRSTRRSPFSR